MDDFGEEEVVENPTLRAAYNLEPLHQNQALRWNYEVHLIGEKIYDKVIHLCEVCELPILVYGRMLPCKHIFCFDCARKYEKACRRCQGKVQKVEKSALGTVYVCTHGAPKHSTKGCRRTYLSQRDLQSHIAHRHVPKPSTTSSKHPPTTQAVLSGPVQLPLTQQQAAQHATQKQVSPIQSHLQSSSISVQGSLVTSVANLSHSQTSALVASGQQMSPIPPLIPGLGELRPVTNVSPAVLSQSSPMSQPAPSPNSLQQAMGLSYNPSPQTNSDIYRPLDMATMGQQQQHQQSLGMTSVHLQSVQNMQQYSQPQQFPGSTALLPQMGNNQQIAPTMPTQMHPITLSHQHSSLSASQNLDSYSKAQNIQTPLQQTPQSRNLITVPIQDEGQYRPQPYVPSMVSQTVNPSYPQARQNMPTQPQGYTQHPNSFASPTNFPHLGGQAQNIGCGVQNLGHPQSQGHPQGMGIQVQNMSHSQGLVGQAQTLGHPHSIGPQSQNLGNQAQNLGGHAKGIGGHPQNLSGSTQNMGGQVSNMGSQGQGMGNSPQGMQFNPSSGMQSGSPGMMLNQRPGNVHPRALMGAAAMGHFPPQHWQSPRIIQPRMTQGQPRPRPDNQFNPNNFYS
ncbi:unnamed protein product [Lymnaea stagnalis]|uniref:E3 ubiquitin-protein ligase Hakai n=1 Tax=Lymnaea stagnalis TaxID=6523 RepID=A0AAV2GZ63_LYMST